MTTPERLVAVTFIHSSDGQIVVGKKPPGSNGAYNGKWVIPGGFVEVGETTRHAAWREALEETQLDLSSCDWMLLDTDCTDEADVPLLSGECIQRRMRFARWSVGTGVPASEMPLSPTEELPAVEWAQTEQLKDYAPDMCWPLRELSGRLGLLAIAA